MQKFGNKQKRVGVLRGGGGKKHERSLKDGSDVLVYMIENMYPKWKPIDIFVDPNGVWHLSGVEILPADLIHKVDVVWNTAGAAYQQLLENLSVPTIGHSGFASLLADNPGAFSEFALRNGIRTPRKIVFPVYQEDIDGEPMEYAAKKAREVWQKFAAPWVVRAYNQDKNVAAKVAKTFPDLVSSIGEFLAHGDSILVEELIPGKIATTHIVPNFRGDKTYHLPVHSNYNLSTSEKESIASLAKKLYGHLNSHYLKADFVVHPRTGVHLLEFSLNPDLRDKSSLYESSQSVGVRMSHIINHILEGKV